MTPAQFRRLALSLPEATQGGHMGHPDFRVRGKIFVTLAWPDASWWMVKLTPEQQRMFVRGGAAAFVPVAGGWGRRGSTNVRLALARPAAVRGALVAAWLNTAPAGLAAELESRRPPSRGGVLPPRRARQRARATRPAGTRRRSR